MSRLLRANFVSMWKSKVFWICTVFVAVLDIYFIYRYGEKLKIRMMAHNFFYCNIIIMIVGAVFMGIFIGTEYSDGTIRNKLAVGHSRSELYFANFITCMTASLMMYFVWIVVQLLSGAYLLIGEKNLGLPIERIPILLLSSLIAMAAQTSISLFISMMLHKRLIGAVTVIITAIAFVLIAESINERLNEPEYYAETIILADDNGEVYEEQISGTKNPRYLTGTKRKIYESAYCILPFCQLYQISDVDYYYYNLNFTQSGRENPLDHAEIFPLYAICVFTAVSGVGILLFRKKDIK